MWKADHFENLIPPIFSSMHPRTYVAVQPQTDRRTEGLCVIGVKSGGVFTHCSPVHTNVKHTGFPVNLGQTRDWEGGEKHNRWLFPLLERPCVNEVNLSNWLFRNYHAAPQYPLESEKFRMMRTPFLPESKLVVRPFLSK